VTSEQLAQIEEISHWYKNPTFGRIIGRMMRENGSTTVSHFVMFHPEAAQLALDTVSEFLQVEEEEDGLQFSLPAPEELE
jgi:hypothetical protein